MKNNERLHALKILTALLEEKSSLSQLMPASAEVTPMTKEICFGFVVIIFDCKLLLIV